MYIEAQTINQSIFFYFKSPLLYIWCIYVTIFFNIFFLLQVDNLNLATNLENYCFKTLLIACKCTPLCKKLDCNVKNEPPYFAATCLDGFMVCNIDDIFIFLKNMKDHEGHVCLVWTSLKKSNFMPY